MFKHDVPVATSNTVCDMNIHDAIAHIEEHAMTTTLDPSPESPHSWSDSFINSAARPTNIDDLERALMSFKQRRVETYQGDSIEQSEQF